MATRSKCIHKIIISILYECLPLICIIFQYRWTRPGTGISSIDENSILDGPEQRQNNFYGKQSYEDYSIHTTLHLNEPTEHPKSLNYLNPNTPLASNNSPPLSDLNPISLPYLEGSLTTRPVSSIHQVILAE